MTPQKYPQNLHTQKVFIFLKTPKNIEIQNFKPPKNDPSLRMYENIRVPPLPPPWDRETGERETGERAEGVKSKSTV